MAEDPIGNNGVKKDNFVLKDSDNPGSLLVTTQMNGRNYKTWSIQMKKGLAAKQKLGFINGKIKMPSEDHESYDDWYNVDSMVQSWILNTLTPQLKDAFLYVSSAKDLWDKLLKRFGGSCDPQEYTIKRELSSLSQGNSSLSLYFTNLCKLWDELQIITPLPQCTCGKCTCQISEKVTKVYEKSRTIQFLMGLNESYNQVRQQVLMMDPCPPLDKVFSMIMNVEEQREVYDNYSSNVENGGVIAYAKEKGQKIGQKWKRADKEDKYCTYCKKNGHEKDDCFKLNGVPDWYNDLKKQRTKVGGKFSKVNMAGNPFEEEEDEENGSNSIRDIIQQELSKLIKNNKQEGDDSVNCAFDFAGPTD